MIGCCDVFCIVFVCCWIEDCMGYMNFVIQQDQVGQYFGCECFEICVVWCVVDVGLWQWMIQVVVFGFGLQVFVVEFDLVDL